MYAASEIINVLTGLSNKKGRITLKIDTSFLFGAFHVVNVSQLLVLLWRIMH